MPPRRRKGHRDARGARYRSRSRGAHRRAAHRDGAPLAARCTRSSPAAGRSRPLTDAERDECFDCFDTEDFRIGYAAFLAKRKPEFRDDERAKGRPAGRHACVELAQIMSGPTAGMMLADLGADVIKVEKLPGGDDSRGYTDPRINGVSALPDDEPQQARPGAEPQARAGREVLLRLCSAPTCCWRTSARHAREARLGYDVLRRANPDLLLRRERLRSYGPYADKGGFDLIAQGFGGLMSITGEPDRPPAKVAHRCRTSTAASSPRSASLRLAHKLRTGEGQVVDTR